MLMAGEVWIEFNTYQVLGLFLVNTHRGPGGASRGGRDDMVARSYRATHVSGRFNDGHVAFIYNGR